MVGCTGTIDPPMAKINIVCESCGAEREVDEKLAGSVLPCAHCEASIRVPIPNIAVGVKLGGFVLEKLLGFGAMGEVWLARQLAMDRLVALKLLSREYTLDSSFIDRFLKEVRISAKMDHPNIITAFDAGCDNDIYYLAITYVDGETLEDRFERIGALPEKEALKITMEISEALCYAWNDFKIIHRDIKPANIMIDRKGVAKLMDMGISKSANEGAGLTMTGTIIGTPYYMSPEQGTGDRELDFHSDIYSLGATLYHIVTGVLPFDATTALGIVSKHITEPLPSPLDKNPAVSEQCSSLIETMMAKSKEDRQASWEEVISDIRLVLDGKFPASKPRPSPGDSLIMPAAETLSAKSVENPIANYPNSMPIDIFNGNDGADTPTLGEKLEKHSKKTGLTLGVVAVLVFLLIAAIALLLITRHKSDAIQDSSELLLSNSVQAKNDDVESAKDESSDNASQSASTSGDVESPSTDSQVKFEDRLRRCEEMLKFAEQYANEHPDEYEMSMKNFEELAKFADGTKYKLMANVRMARLEKEKEAAVEKLLEDLDGQAEVLAGKNQFDKAAELYRSYAGALAEETKKQRLAKAEELDAKGAEFAKKRKTEIERRKAQRKDITYEISKKMAVGDWKEAGKYLSKVEAISKKAGKLKPLLDELLNYNNSLTSNLAKQVGKTLLVKTSKGLKRVKVAKVKGKSFYYKEEKGTVVIFRKHSLADIPPEESFRIAGLSAAARLAFSVAESIKRNDFPKAFASLAKSKSSFSKFLQLGAREILAETAFGNMLRRLRVSDKLMEPDALLKKINNSPVSPLLARRRALAAKIYHNKFKSTLFAAKYHSALKALAQTAPLDSADSGSENDNGKNNDNVGAVREKIGSLGIDAVNKLAGNGEGKVGLSQFDPQSLRSPEDLRDALEKISPKYKGEGRFYFWRGRLVGADLNGAEGITDNALALLAKLRPKMLDLGDTSVTDLTPLEDLELRKLSLAKTDIEDLSPLSGMSELRMLSIAGTKVTDPSPLNKLRSLEMLDVSDTKIKNLSVLSGMPLRGLRLINCRLRSYSFLRKLKELEALEPRSLWRKIPGKEYKANQPQHFPFDRGDRRPPPRKNRMHVRGFDD